MFQIITINYYRQDMAPKEFTIEERNVGITCTYKNNPNCFATNESTYNLTCCTPNQPCGILQGGCSTDKDCFDNLECITDSCSLDINGTNCCQAPGRKPGLFLDLISLLNFFNTYSLLSF